MVRAQQVSFTKGILLKTFTILIFSSLCIWASVSHAESVTFKTFALKSGYIDGVGRIEISPSKGGFLRLTQDKNKCDSEGIGCTRMAVLSTVVRARVIEDRRPVDGDLVLELTPEISLSVGSGNNREGWIYYNCLVKKNSGEIVTIKMTANVGVILK